jgi:hypothetical protein
MKYTIGIIILVVAALIYLIDRSDYYRNAYSTSIANQKVLLNNNDSLKNKTEVLSLTIDQLNYYNDSINQKIKEVQEELGIKNKNIKSIHYITETITKTDTLVLKDTIFREDFKLDTLIQDEWYKLSLSLAYPGRIAVSPSFNSEKYIVASYRKETVNPPKKFFLFRWFQRKHKVVEVEIVEKNPYINTKQQRYIEIIK